MPYKEVMFVRPAKGRGARHYMVVSSQLHNPADLFPGGKKTPFRSHWIWDWMGPKAGPDAWENKPISYP